MLRQHSKVCPRCKHQSGADDKYCGNCGVAFIEQQGNFATSLGRGIPTTPVFFPRFTSLMNIPNIRRVFLLVVLLLIIVAVFFYGINIGKESTTAPNNTGITVVHG